MQVIEKTTALNKILEDFHAKNLKIGFVPTMGALHNGHISLIEKALDDNDLVVCSIFVNPKQFNDKDDLINYPRTLSDDIKLLKKTGCHILFAPPVEEVYPTEFVKKEKVIYDFGQLDKVMEGFYRPGHFQGVATVVHRLFEIVKPHQAYFGNKDYQQVAVIRHLVSSLNIAVKIISCDTKREHDGVAMSSRNKNLTPKGRQMAAHIPRILNLAKEKTDSLSVEELKQWVDNEIEKTNFLKLDYFEISDAQSLNPLKKWNTKGNNIGCIAVFAKKVRLIDNIIL
ncbi:MAG: pantoate--beta-alanine ligase [Bacteroidota bacterium]|nr:pantoate--beta-alanine ligase [Bacteroidota bacterium]